MQLDEVNWTDRYPQPSRQNFGNQTMNTISFIMNVRYSLSYCSGWRMMWSIYFRNV